MPLISTSDLRALAAQSTPARILVGRSGASYRTQTWLELRTDHAAARDAVADNVNPSLDLRGVHELTELMEAETQARDKSEYLLRPDLGRRLSNTSRSLLKTQAPTERDIQFVIGDGLSARAVITQVPVLFPLLWQQAITRGWSLGIPLFLRHCRVGVMNEIGDLLAPRVVILLIGERPGLATAESLSAYFAYQPRSGDTDAKRNLISNIHARGVPTDEAATRIIAFAAQLIAAKSSGVAVKERRLEQIH